MDEISYLRILAEKLMFYASPKKLEAMLEDLHALWVDHRQEGCTEMEIFEWMGTPELLMEHIRREGRFRALLLLAGGSLALALSITLIYTTIYVSAGWMLPAAFLLLLLGMWLLAGGTGMGLLARLTRAHPHGVIPCMIPFFAILLPIAACLFCLPYLQPERMGNICTAILRLCILAMAGQAMWCSFKTRRMGGGYFFLVIHAVGSAFCLLSFLRRLTRMDLPDCLVPGSAQWILLLAFLRSSLPYYLVGLLLSLLLLSRTHMAEKEGMPWMSR